MKSLRIILVCVLTMLLAVGNAAAVITPTTVTATVSTTSVISVTPSTFAFGTIGATATSYRFRNPPALSKADVGYVAAGAYEIRVYTDNGVGPIPLADAENPLRRGFIRDGTAATANRLYLKIWCQNISGNYFIPATGPALMTPSSQTDYLWKGKDFSSPPDGDIADLYEAGIFNEATLGVDINGDGDIGDIITAGTVAEKKAIGEGPSFSYIRELDTHTEGDTVAAAKTRCVLAYDTLVRPEGSLGNPFPVCLGVDLTGVANGTYLSGNNGPVPPLAPSTLYPITPGQNHSGGVIFELTIY